MTDLLAEQSEETLLRMQEAVKAELARLTIEAQQIEQALAKKSRRERASGRGGGLSREQVFAVVESEGRALTSAEVRDVLVSQGITTSPNAVRNHLTRLVDENGWLVRTEDGRFMVAGADFAPAPVAADEDIPF